ncbi:unnamed protein product [Caenorhabditis sp. 36 PRJEB53466]|nr:unnamed protein product [Caenorhabditis sp. 36 PRJEB53466]
MVETRTQRNGASYAARKERREKAAVKRKEAQKPNLVPKKKPKSKKKPAQRAPQRRRQRAIPETSSTSGANLSQPVTILNQVLHETAAAPATVAVAAPTAVPAPVAAAEPAPEQTTELIEELVLESMDSVPELSEMFNENQTLNEVAQPLNYTATSQSRNDVLNKNEENSARNEDEDLAAPPSEKDFPEKIMNALEDGLQNAERQIEKSVRPSTEGNTENEMVVQSNSTPSDCARERFPVPSYNQISRNKRISQMPAGRTKKELCDCPKNNKNCSDNSCLNRAMLMECPETCCRNCQNQRFKKKEYANLEAFNTGTAKGCGLRATGPIKKGSFLIEYVGEVMNKKDYERRKKEYARNGNQRHHYFFDTVGFTIDATRSGNISRFANHSCDPNTIAEKWFVPRTRGNMLRIGFFALRDIVTDEEITFDYQFENYGKDAQKCYCGASVCKGIIGRSPKTLSEEEEEEELPTAEEEGLLRAVETMRTRERKLVISKVLKSMAIGNRKYARRVVAVAEKMTDPSQRQKLLKKMFTADTASQTQARYAHLMAPLMIKWLGEPDRTGPHLVFVQQILLSLVKECFINVAKETPDLIEKSASWCESTLNDNADCFIVTEAMVSSIGENFEKYKDVQKTIATELESSLNRTKEIARRLKRHWFNRSVSFRIPKKARLPEPATTAEEKDYRVSPIPIDAASPPDELPQRNGDDSRNWNQTEGSRYERKSWRETLVNRTPRDRNYRYHHKSQQNSGNDRRQWNHQSPMCSPEGYKRRRIENQEGLSEFESHPYMRSNWQSSQHHRNNRPIYQTSWNFEEEATGYTQTPVYFPAVPPMNESSLVTCAQKASLGVPQTFGPSPQLVQESYEIVTKMEKKLEPLFVWLPTEDLIKQRDAAEAEVHYLNSLIHKCPKDGKRDTEQQAQAIGFSKQEASSSSQIERRDQQEITAKQPDRPDFGTELQKLVDSEVRTMELSEATENKIQWLVKILTKELLKKRNEEEMSKMPELRNFHFKMDKGMEKKAHEYIIGFVARKNGENALWKNYMHMP